MKRFFIVRLFAAVIAFFTMCKKGDTGPAGATGDTGATGAAGPQGPTGIAGNANVTQYTFGVMISGVWSATRCR